MENKDYKKWFNNKSLIHNEKQRPFFHEREIWFCSLGSNIGFEQDGRGEKFLRPIVIIKKFNNQVCFVVPLTKNHKKGIHYFNFEYTEGVVSTAIISQLRLIDSKRFEYKSGNIKEEDYIKLKEKLKQLIA